ncbi:MAG: associated Golgi protein [Clostridiaceae bacterium]|jgi:uncharacterized membrane protein YdjX (TVP38/TMEM64 family)|nr:associated Golgi protein [Clostridiaceae bacterium]
MGKEFKNIFALIKKNKDQIIFWLFLIFLFYSAFQYFNKYFYEFKDPERVKKIIMSYGKYSMLAFLILQFIQVAVFFIPGEIIQISGGFIYGTWSGSLISMIGISIGSIFAYSVSHYYGRPLLIKIINKKNINFFDKVSNYGKIDYVVFLLYLIPGIPKDALAYICGVSKLNLRKFIFLSTLGRVPGVIVSTYFGANINSGNNGVLIFIAILMSLLFSVGIYKGDKIIKSIVKRGK